VGQCTEHDQQDGSTDKGNYDFHQDVGGRDTHETCQPPAQETAEDTDHDVPDQAHALACEHLAGQEPGDAADDDPDDETTHNLANLRYRFAAVI